MKEVIMERRILLTECKDDVGLIAKITNVCFLFHMNVIRQDQFASHEDNRFFIVDPKKKNEYHNSYTVLLKDNIIEELKRRLNL